jgi:hypothetical protein
MGVVATACSGPYDVPEFALSVHSSICFMEVRMRLHRWITLALVSVVVSACYHATIDTGLSPGPQKVEQKWATGWIYGLVPPATVDAMAQCSSGVARVETRHSFLNMLAQGLTFGIFAPMEIVVTCAGGEEEDLPAETDAEGKTTSAKVVSDRDGFVSALKSGEAFLVELR